MLTKHRLMLKLNSMSCSQVRNRCSPPTPPAPAFSEISPLQFCQMSFRGTNDRPGTTASQPLSDWSTSRQTQRASSNLHPFNSHAQNASRYRTNRIIRYERITPGGIRKACNTTPFRVSQCRWWYCQLHAGAMKIIHNIPVGSQLRQKAKRVKQRTMGEMDNMKETGSLELVIMLRLMLM